MQIIGNSYLFLSRKECPVSESILIKIEDVAPSIFKHVEVGK